MRANSQQKNRSVRKKRKKSKTKVFSFFLYSLLFATFIGAGIMGGLAVAVIKSAEPIDPSQIYTLLDENSVILDKDGNVIEKVESEGLRTIVKYDTIPDDLKNAFIAIEDQEFFNHKGINPKRIIKAILEDIKAGAPVQGASTITQQLAKNLYLSHDKTLNRKFKELYYSFQIERHLTKEQILEAYLNTIYLGGGAKGVQAASYTYFSKNVNDLDLAECALLAGITKNPFKYSPLKKLKKEDVDPNKHYILDDKDEIYTLIYDEKYKDRQQLVLKMMKDENMITETEYMEAIDENIKSHLKPGKLNSHEISSYFIDQVKRDVVESIMKELGKTKEEAEDMLYHQGLRIYTTMDLKMQRTLEEVYNNRNLFPKLIIKKDRSGNILNKNRSILLYQYKNLVNSKEQFIIPKSDFQYDQFGNLILMKGKRLLFNTLYKDGKIADIQITLKDAYTENTNRELLMLKGGVLKIPSAYKQYDHHKNLIIDAKFLSSKPGFLIKDTNGNLLINKGNYYISNQGIIQPQSAMVIIDYRTGEIKALVGGRNIKGQKLYNRAINPRQPGSSIKPLSVYTPAIDNGWTAADVVDDVPHYDHNGHLWPRNWYKGYRGLSTLREGIEQSMNVVAVKIVEQIGLNTSIEYLKKMGITTVSKKGNTNDYNLSAMALGGMSKGISPLELTAAYGSLANKGTYIKPKSFIKITDRNGNIILEDTGYKNIAVRPEVAFMITDMMRTGVSSGVASAAKLDSGNDSIPVAGKTGTTSDNYDAWFVGYTPYYVGGTWIGNDIQIQLNQGSKVSAKLWKTIMTKIHKDLPPKKFDKPKNIISVKIDTKSGKLPTSLSYKDPRGTVQNEYFIKGTEPKEHDHVHVLVEVDTTTNKLPTPFCPSSLIGKKVFVKRPVPYSPSRNGNMLPRDYIYEAPTTRCTLHSPFSNEMPIDSLSPTENNEPLEDDSSFDQINSFDQKKPTENKNSSTNKTQDHKKPIEN